MYVYVKWNRFLTWFSRRRKVTSHLGLELCYQCCEWVPPALNPGRASFASTLLMVQCAEAETLYTAARWESCGMIPDEPSPKSVLWLVGCSYRFTRDVL